MCREPVNQNTCDDDEKHREKYPIFSKSGVCAASLHAQCPLYEIEQYLFYHGGVVSTKLT